MAHQGGHTGFGTKANRETCQQGPSCTRCRHSPGDQKEGNKREAGFREEGSAEVGKLPWETKRWPHFHSKDHGKLEQKTQASFCAGLKKSGFIWENQGRMNGERVEGVFLGKRRIDLEMPCRSKKAQCLER